MPGRQAHGRPLLANPNKKRKSGGGAKKANGNGGGAGGSGGAPLSSRTSGGAPKTRQGGRVDVMALAEKQITERRMKGVRTRDLQIDRDSKRRRGGDDDEDGDEDDEDEDKEQQGGSSKRRRPNNDGDDSSDEIHSDSEGNEWREGVGADDDDSEIDSDEAFGDSDDEMFDAFSFRGSTANQQKPKKAKKPRKTADEFDGFDNPSDYSDEDVGDDGGELGDDAIDLAAALDIVSSDEDEAGDSNSKASAKTRKSKKSKKSKSKKQADSDEDMSDASATSPQSGSGSEDSDDASDESISGSESDDEEDSDEDSDEDDEDEDDDEGVFAKSDALKSIASAYAGDDSDEEDSDADMANASANPYKFNASIGALTTKDRNLKKSLKATANSSSDKTLNVPLLPMQQDEKLRVAAAGKAHETLDRWTDTVKHNRRAEHLTFDVAGSLASTGLNTTTLTPINSQATAQTDLERTILSIMEESGLGARAQEDARHQEKLRKQQELADNPPVLSPDELKALIGQKRRERELKSQEVARAKRIKKIKSKAYRRVHRRERQRAEEMLADSDAEHDSDGNADSEAEREAQHRQRAMERMGSRHRDSKWAKKGKGTNRAAWDDDYRAGLVDMARQDEELRRRVEGAGVGGKEAGKGDDDDEDDEDDDSYGEESDDDKFRERTKKKLEALASKGEEPKGLMGIAFMRKAEDARRKENDDAVAEIMRDLDRDSDDSDGDKILFEDENKATDEDAVVGRRTYGPVAGAGATAAQAQQRTKKSKASAATEDKAPAAAPAAPAAQSSGFAESTPRAPAKVSAPGDAGSWTVVPSKNGSKKKEPKSSKLTTVANSDSLAGVTTDGRLVLEAVVDDVLEQNAVARERVALARSAPAPAQNGNGSDTSSSGSDSEDDAGPRTGGGASVSRVDRNGNVVQFRGQNEKLLLKALGEDHAAAEFAAEKVRQAAEEAEAWEEERSLGKKKRNEFVAGWGSWTGDGLSKRTIKAQEEKKAKMMDAKGEKKAIDKKIAGRKDAKLERVIISERRVRKTEKYLASTLPHEFETRSQYERSLRLPVGPEWSTMFAFQDATKPRVLKKQGVVLPMSKPAL